MEAKIIDMSNGLSRETVDFLAQMCRDRVGFQRFLKKIDNSLCPDLPKVERALEELERIQLET